MPAWLGVAPRIAALSSRRGRHISLGIDRLGIGSRSRSTRSSRCRIVRLIGVAICAVHERAQEHPVPHRIPEAVTTATTVHIHRCIAAVWQPHSLRDSARRKVTRRGRGSACGACGRAADVSPRGRWRPPLIHCFTAALSRASTIHLSRQRRIRAAGRVIVAIGS